MIFIFLRLLNNQSTSLFKGRYKQYQISMISFTIWVFLKIKISDKGKLKVV